MRYNDHVIRRMMCLGVAQFGSVPEWGSGGRKFKSSHPDVKPLEINGFKGFCFAPVTNGDHGFSVFLSFFAGVKGSKRGSKNPAEAGSIVRPQPSTGYQDHAVRKLFDQFLKRDAGSITPASPLRMLKG